MRIKLRKKTKKKVFIAAVAIVLVLAIAVGIIYWQRPDWFYQGVAFFENLFKKPDGLQRSDGELQIHFVNVGQGDCILILFPDGKTMMIDAGNSSNSTTFKNSMLSYIDPLLPNDKIDYLMLTHGDSDHCYYLDEVIAAYDVDKFFMPNILPTDVDATLPNEKLNLFTDEDTIDTNCFEDYFNAALNEEGAEIVINVGSIVIESATYRLTFYCPSVEFWADRGLSSAELKNAISPIGILEYNGFKVVFTGDSNEINEEIFIDTRLTPIDCDVLKVAHHGSETSSTAEFLDFVNCEYAVISVGEGNSHGHPRAETLQRFSSRSMTVYRTDLNNNIVLSIKDEIKFSVAS